jgi:hypothetical protein
VSIPYALILLCSSGFMVMEEKRHKRLGKPFPTSISRTVYQAIYTALVLVGVSTVFAATIA